MPLGVPVVPLVHRKIPPDPAPRDAPAGLAGSVSAHAPGPFGPNDLSGGLNTTRPGGRPEPESPTAACGRAVASTRESSAAGPAGSSGITTRPAAEDADQDGSVAERVRHADGHPCARRHPGAVQAVGPDSGGAPEARIGQCPGSRAILKVRCLKVRCLKIWCAAVAGRSLFYPFRYHCRAPFWSLVTPASVAGAGSGRAGEPGPGVGRSAAGAEVSAWTMAAARAR